MKALAFGIMCSVAVTSVLMCGVWLMLELERPKRETCAEMGRVYVESRVDFKDYCVDPKALKRLGQP